MTDMPPTPPAQITQLNAQPLTIRAADGYQLLGELTLPAGARVGQKFPVVILLHGSGAHDMNETLRSPGGEVMSTTFLDITRRLNAAGYAVFRFNKRGVTDIGPVRLPESERVGPAYTISGITKDALDVLNAVRKLPQVNAEQVFLLGHSEGTLVASKLAGQHPGSVRGLILIGTVGDTFRETLHFQSVTFPIKMLHLLDADKDGFLTIKEVSEGSSKMGGDLAKVAEEFELDLQQNGNYWIFAPTMKPDAQGRVSIDSTLKNRLEEYFSSYPNLPDTPPQLAEYFKDGDVFGSVTQLLPTYKGPVLMLQGADDPQTTLEAAQKAFAAARAAGNTQIQMNVYAGYGHTLAPAAKNGLPTLGPIAAGPLNDMASWLGTMTGR